MWFHDRVKKHVASRNTNNGSRPQLSLRGHNRHSLGFLLPMCVCVVFVCLQLLSSAYTLCFDPCFPACWESWRSMLIDLKRRGARLLCCLSDRLQKGRPMVHEQPATALRLLSRAFGLNRGTWRNANSVPVLNGLTCCGWRIISSLPDTVGITQIQRRCESNRAKATLLAQIGNVWPHLSARDNSAI